MNTLILAFQLLGQNLYSRPTAENKPIRDHLEQLPELLDWSDSDKIAKKIEALPRQSLDELDYQFSVLFEGQGNMTCPPWGSVYLDRNNIVFGESTMEYREFLRQNGIEIKPEYREPEDQFGLMLLALSQLLESDKSEAGITLITDHLLPWGNRYLELLANNDVSPFYAIVAELTKELFDVLQSEFQYSVLTKPLYF